MNYICSMSNFMNQLREALNEPLPGHISHIKMSPQGRGDTEAYLQQMQDSPRISAVMVLLFVENGKYKLVLIKRPDYAGVHSGQIAFPGGKVEEADGDLIQTALRETHEEVGVLSSEIEILGALSRIYIPPSNFLVYPFVGYTAIPPIFKLDPIEVESLVITPLEILLNDHIRAEGVFNAGGKQSWKINAPYYNIENHRVWGATAAILSELIDILNSLKLDKPGFKEKE